MLRINLNHEKKKILVIYSHSLFSTFYLDFFSHKFILNFIFTCFSKLNAFFSKYNDFNIEMVLFCIIAWP